MRLNESEIQEFANEYVYSGGDEKKLIELKNTVQERGYLLLSELVKIAKWKSIRSAGHTFSNTEKFVKEITKFSFFTTNERARIEVLTLLDGVKFPTASVILHFFHKGSYPILDVRALWSLGMNKPKTYDFSFWWEYVERCRALSEKYSLGMRTLDKALWQYSKIYQESF